MHGFVSKSVSACTVPPLFMPHVFQVSVYANVYQFVQVFVHACVCQCVQVSVYPCMCLSVYACFCACVFVSMQLSVTHACGVGLGDLHGGWVDWRTAFDAE